jgi:hypothetical protein
MQSSLGFAFMDHGILIPRRSNFRHAAIRSIQRILVWIREGVVLQSVLKVNKSLDLLLEQIYVIMLFYRCDESEYIESDYSEQMFCQSIIIVIIVIIDLGGSFSDAQPTTVKRLTTIFRLA